MTEVSAAERALLDARSRSIDYEGIAALQFLGNYQRALPVSMQRMMENAYDWEHLPYVHASSFSSIEGVASGPWGWQAKVLPANTTDEFQLIELLVDRSNNYWATTVVSGPGESVQIHTQATALAEHEIEIDVRFYSSEPVPQQDVPTYLEFLTAQYALLYDEDVELMMGRQQALNTRDQEQSAPVAFEVEVGVLADLPRDQTTLVEASHGRYCVRYHDGAWLVHDAVCPHMLGPLEELSISGDGILTCPWHGYQFDALTGENLGGMCRSLRPAPELVEREGKLVLVFDGGGA